MRDRALWLLIPTSPPLVLGIVVVVALIAAETLVVYPLRRVAPEISLSRSRCCSALSRRWLGRGRSGQMSGVGRATWPR
jgi:hypothetical protein